jgi:hypothetical protein
MKKIFALLIFVNTVFAQYTNVRVSSTSSTSDEEVSIAINPNNPQLMCGGANINRFYFSSNAGQTWTQKNMTSPTFGVWGDPCLTFDRLGNILYGHLSNSPSPGYWIDRIVVQKSTDNGVTWNNGAGIGFNSPKEQDKEWLAIDFQNNSFRDNVYVTWTEFDNYGSSSFSDSSRILFSRSTDFGVSFSVPIKISDVGGNCIDDDLTVEGAVPAIGPNGEIYVSWSGPLGIMFDKSTNGGITWGVDKFVTTQPGGWAYDIPGISRCNGLPITSCDTSHSPFRGNIYINWSDQRNGSDNTDVFFIKSTNGGNTWGPVKKINSDVTSRHQFFTWMNVDQVTGIIYFVFYDRRNTSGSLTDVYLARSRDGGETFENFLISQSSFNPNSSVFFGDYTGISAWNHIVRPIWMRLDNSTLSVWTALIYDSSSVVPVELSSFNAFVIGRNIKLSWQTSSETNNRGFEVERLLVKDLQNCTPSGCVNFNNIWETIAFVDGKGTTNEVSSYSYTDNDLESGVYKYRLRQLDFDGAAKFSNEVEVEFFIPKVYVLDQNYPNPFNPKTTIGFQLPEKAFVTLKIYDTLGNELITLLNEQKNPGVHEVNFNSAKLSSGVYYYKLITDKFTDLKKMVILK